MPSLGNYDIYSDKNIKSSKNMLNSYSHKGARSYRHL